MNHYARLLVPVLIGINMPGLILSGQENLIEKTEGYHFTNEISLPATSVKNQYRSNTCWSFASVSFIESELLRTGKGTFDLSEMYFVRRAYVAKAEKYVRMHGKNNFDDGGLVLDVLDTWKKIGMVPETAYEGLAQGDSLPVHGEMAAVLKGYLDQVIRNPNRTLTPVWIKGFEGILDAYLGPEPNRFEFNGTSHSPRSFASDLGLNPEDYVAIGSFTHHPFYEEFILEVPDNWNWGTIQNVPLDEMMEVLDHALEKGYTVCWDADVSETDFERKLGVATIPDASATGEETEVTQEIRQRGFDNYQTTDDHLMHITGRASDQEGKRFYLVKNSWGTRERPYDGYIYASSAYMQSKTIFFVVHKEAVPKAIAKRLGL